MDRKPQKGFFAAHAKSSAIAVSVGIHALLILAAVSFVAISLVVKDDPGFTVKQVQRPRMNLRKLQVPATVKKPPNQPKLRKQIVAAPKLNRAMPDIKMPEIVGVKGGLGSGGGGYGGTASLGFVMPELNIFGVKGKGERIFFTLDASGRMMVDEIGGVRSYEIIKSELIRILEELNPMVLFNVSVYEDYRAKMLFPRLVAATPQHIDQAVEWLKPLNRFTSERTSQQQYGIKTTGSGGIAISREKQFEPLKGKVSHWATPMMVSMSEQADTVFILTSGWGFLAYKIGESDWGDSDEARFQRKLAEAKERLKKENERRAQAGEPPRIIPATNYDRNLVKAYFPGEPVPPWDKFQQYEPLELFKAFSNQRMTNSAQSGGALRKKDAFAVNVIQFCEKGAAKEAKFTKLISLLSGEYRMIEGLEAVESYVNGSGK